MMRGMDRMKEKLTWLRKEEPIITNDPTLALASQTPDSLVVVWRDLAMNIEFGQTDWQTETTNMALNNEIKPIAKMHNGTFDLSERGGR